MARGDKTGPDGQGPMRGRGLGYCNGYSTPGYLHNKAGRGKGRRFVSGKGPGLGFCGGRISGKDKCTGQGKGSEQGKDAGKE